VREHREPLPSAGGRPRQFLTESLLLGAVGGIAGLVLGIWSVRGFLALDPTMLPREHEVALAPRVFAFTAFVALAAALVFGVVPAVQLARTDINASLRDGGRQVGGGQRRLRASLVVAEIALALMLVASAGLLLRSFYNLQHVDKGYDADRVLTFSLFLPEASYSSPDRITTFYHQLLPSLHGVPGVEASGMIFGLPLGEFNGHSTFSIEGRHVADEDVQSTYVRVIGGEYLQAMRIPLRRGRPFADADRATAPLVAIMNETAARRYFPNEDPIGHRVRLHASFSAGTYGFRAVVGVIGDVKHRGLAEETEPEIYIPYDQQAMDFGVVVARTRVDPLSVVSGIRDRIHAIDPALPVSDVMPMRTIVADSVANDRFMMILLGVFAALALGLAAIGIYGVMSYAVSQRTREIGLRMALGAASDDVLRMVTREGLRLSALGVTIGLTASAAAARSLTGLLFGVSAADPLTYAAVAVVIVATALAASYIPARRASRVEPMSALRTD
jgi:putative ABC transport system permease protein